MRDSATTQSIRQLAIVGDRTRRVDAAVRVTSRWVPVATGLMCAVAVATLAFDGPRLLGVWGLSLVLVAGVVQLLAARVSRRVSDEAVKDLDREAGLGGSLWSAYWFAGNDRSVPSESTDDSWVRFHLTEAEAAARQVDWRKVYPTPNVRARLALTAVFSVVTVAVVAWPSRPPLFTRSVSTDASPTPGTPDSGETLPSTLVPQLVEGIRAIRSGRAPSAGALSAIGQALQLAEHSQSAGREIERLLAETARDDSGLSGFVPFWDDGHGRNEDQWGEALSQSGLSWGYEEALARAADQAASSPATGGRDGTQKPGPDAGASSEAGVANEDASALGPGEAGGAVGLTDARGTAESFSALLFGRQQASGTPSTAGAASQQAAARAALAAALRTEVVHARVDAPGANLPRTGSRRATTAADTGAAQAATITATITRTRATQPPAIPDDRRALVRDFFHRSGDPQPPGQP